MNCSKYWILKAKDKTNLSENKLANLLGTSSGTLGDAKVGRARIPPHVSQKIAELLDIPYPFILASVASDHAKTEEERDAWLALLPENLAVDITGKPTMYHAQSVVAPFFRWLKSAVKGRELINITVSLSGILITGLVLWMFPVSGQVGLSVMDT